MSLLPDNALVAGLALGSGSLLSVGPNSLMLIREGLTGGRVCACATLVCGSYLLLLGLALLAAGTVDTDVPMLRATLAWLGLITLVWFAMTSFRAARNASRASGTGGAQPDDSRAFTLRVIKIVWSNPLTYLELFLIPAALCGTFKVPALRVEFILGVVVMGTVCCYGYSYGGRLCAAVLRYPRALQMFDVASGVLLSLVALSMAVKLLV